jgi:hypothetical protein
MSIQNLFRAIVVALAGVAAPASVSAQVFGTFPWQMQPYCNVVTLTLTNTPAGFTLDGADDQCGATNRGSALGVAIFNAAGNVTLNFTIVTAPAGKPVHVSAVVSPANGNGTWTDSVGNSGTFAFFGATPGLPARPLPASGLGAGSVTAVEIATSAVGSSELAPNAVTGGAVADGSLTTADLADGPRAAFAGGNQNLVLPLGVDTVVRALTLTVPANGQVIVNASGRGVASAAGIDLATCSITTGTALDQDATTSIGESAGLSALFIPLGLTRGFTVAPGSFTVRLVCNGATGSVTISDSWLTAMFFPG